MDNNNLHIKSDKEHRGKLNKDFFNGLKSQEENKYNSSSSTYSSFYGSNYGSQTPYNIYNRKGEFKFYEWSSMDNKPIIFNAYNEFEEFAKKNNIIISTNQKYCIGCSLYAHITCVPNKNEIIYAYNEKTLRDKLDKLKRGEKLIDYYDDYDDWD